MSNLPSNALASTTAPAPSSLPEESSSRLLRFRQAFEQIREEIRSVPASDLMPLNLDPLSTVSTVLGAVPNLRPFRERMRVALPEIDLARIDALETYARAAGHAHTRHLGSTRPSEPVAEMAERGAQLRSTLYADVVSLAHRGLMPGGRLEQYRGAVGYKVVAADLFLLSDVLRGSWTNLEGKTPVTLAELDEAEVLADRLLTAIGERAHAPTVPADSALDRQRAFTLLLRAYAEARRAITFLRWYEGDAESIAPSLYAGRGNGNHRRRGDEPNGDDASSASEGPAQTAGSATEPASETASQGSGPLPVPRSGASIEAGMPGSDPFGGS